MKIEEVVDLGLMLDEYGKLLTEKEQNVLSMYVNENMSYQEIANELNITKTAVMCFVKSAQEKLCKFEEILCVCKIKKQLGSMLQLESAEEIKSAINKMLF